MEVFLKCIKHRGFYRTTVSSKLITEWCQLPMCKTQQWRKKCTKVCSEVYNNVVTEQKCKTRKLPWLTLVIKLYDTQQTQLHLTRLIIIIIDAPPFLTLTVAGSCYFTILRYRTLCKHFWRVYLNATGWIHIDMHRTSEQVWLLEANKLSACHLGTLPL